MEKKDFLNQTEIQILIEPVNAGEYELKEYLRARDYKVIDVSNNPHYWKKDIDLFAMNPEGIITSIEVKWDSVINKTGNIFIELQTDLNNQKKGWYQICEAEYLYYGDSVNKQFYKIEMAQLRAYINENKDSLEVRRAVERNGSKISEGYIIPIEALTFASIIQI